MPNAVRTDNRAWRPTDFLIVLLSLAFLGSSLWLLTSAEATSDRVYGILGTLFFSSLLLDWLQAARWARPYGLEDGRVFFGERRRPLAEIQSIRLRWRAPRLFPSYRELGLELDFGDERWWLSLRLGNWERVWDALREALPESGLPDWREDPEVLRALLNRANTSIALPSSVRVQSSGWGRAGLRLLAAIVLGVVAGILADQLGYESLSAIASGAISGGLGTSWAMAAIERKLVIEPPS